MSRTPALLALIALIQALALAPFAFSQEWLTGPWSKGLFGVPGTNQPVVAMVDWDDDGDALSPTPTPTPPKLVLAGEFWLAGGESASRLALWQSRRWQPLPAGFETGGIVKALAVLPYTPLTPQPLVAGGNFGVIVWSAAGWVPLGAGGPTYTVERLFVSPTTGFLYAAEDYPPGSGGDPPQNASNLWVWNGVTWTLLGVAWGGSGRIAAIEEYNGGIVIAGGFGNVGTTPTPEIAILAGGVWSWPGGVFSSTLDCVAVFNGDLYAGGLAGVFRYDGSSWTQLPDAPYGARTMLAFPPGVPTTLIASGPIVFDTQELAAFDGTTWTTLGDGFSTPGVNCLGAHHEIIRYWDNNGSPQELDALDLVVGGGLEHVMRFNFDDGLWRGLGGGVNGTVFALAGTDPIPLAFPPPPVTPLPPAPHVLYAGGTFEEAGGLAVNGVARWRFNQWEPMGGGPFPGSVSSMVLHDDHIGWRLYAAGGFTHMDGIPVDGIARWDEETESWEPVGVGLPGFTAPISLAVAKLTADPEPALYAAGFHGEFARWDGTDWLLLPPIPGIWMQHKLQAAGDDAGQILFCNIRTATGTVAVWTGTGWSEIGIVPTGGEPSCVGVFDPAGAAPCQLYAGGAILENGLAMSKFNGSRWFDPGDPIIGTVKAMKMIQTPAPLLVVAGSFNVVSGGFHIIAWNGSVWDPLDGGLLDNGVETLALFDDHITYFGGPSRTHLYAGGSFESVSFNSASTLGVSRLTFGPAVAEASCLPRLTPCVSDIDGNGLVDLVDLTLLLAQFGSAGSGLSADLNHDGTVGISDLALLLSEFGDVC
jgi:hypothetical protein